MYYYGVSLKRNVVTAPIPANNPRVQNGRPAYPSVIPSWNMEPDTAAPIDRARQVIDAAAPLTAARYRGDGVVLVSLYILSVWLNNYARKNLQNC